MEHEMTASPRPSQCPICSKPLDIKYAPFCSKRCADLDLNRWLKGAYAIAGKAAEDEDEVEPGDQRKPRENDA
jgi:uncharacterized protein